MTIVFQGHIEAVCLGVNGGIDVDVQPERAAVEQQTITLHIPRADAVNWPVGAQVSFTVYALPQPAPPKEGT